MKEMLTAAKAAKLQISQLTSTQKNAALEAMANALIAHSADILAANALDLEAAKDTISTVMLDRLRLTQERIAGMANGIRKVAPKEQGETKCTQKVAGHMYRNTETAPLLFGFR